MATVKRFHYDTHNELRSHLADFVSAYNFAKRLKTLKGLTPYEYICKAWTKEPERFTLNPLQQMPGLNTVRQALRKLSLPAIDPINEAPHSIPPQQQNHTAGITYRAFLHMGQFRARAILRLWESALQESRLTSWGLAMMERRNGTLCRTRRVAETDFDLHRRSEERSSAKGCLLLTRRRIATFIKLHRSTHRSDLARDRSNVDMVVDRAEKMGFARADAAFCLSGV
jgi:hypothetical protein